MKGIGAVRELSNDWFEISKVQKGGKLGINAEGKIYIDSAGVFQESVDAFPIYGAGRTPMQRVPFQTIQALEVRTLMEVDCLCREATFWDRHEVIALIKELEVNVRLATGYGLLQLSESYKKKPAIQKELNEMRTYAETTLRETLKQSIENLENLQPEEESRPSPVLELPKCQVAAQLQEVEAATERVANREMMSPEPQQPIVLKEKTMDRILSLIEKHFRPMRNGETEKNPIPLADKLEKKFKSTFKGNPALRKAIYLAAFREYLRQAVWGLYVAFAEQLKKLNKFQFESTDPKVARLIKVLEERLPEDLPGYGRGERLREDVYTTLQAVNEERYRATNGTGEGANWTPFNQARKPIKQRIQELPKLLKQAGWAKAEEWGSKKKEALLDEFRAARARMHNG